MNIIEAIKSGKRFKRLNYINWLYCLEGDDSFRLQNGTQYYFTKEDILSNQWEVEEEKIELTKSKIYLAFIGSVAYSPLSWTETLESFIKELGFKSSNEISKKEEMSSKKEKEKSGTS